ncbi:MAG TPA: glycosyltransferase [Solirubrobacterales bacterium]|nr:glycosyltransferase [Solirubrobacterales bacterium]
MGSDSVALVHDYLLVSRGAERTFAAIAECWPEAPIYTLLYDEEGTGGRFADREVRTSYLQRLGVGQRGFRSLLPAFPHATRSLPLDRYELIVSSSSAFAHGVARRRGARHVCYCHTPFRYAWFERERALGEVSPLLRRPLDHALWRTREADRRASRDVTRYIANSAITRERIRRYWGRESTVVHPPVEVERFRAREDPEPFFLVVTELVRHKRVDLALEAAARAKMPIRVVGEGPDRARLEARYGERGGLATFLGRVDDAELAGLYARARALVLPNVEEFGIAAVEAQAAGRPVVAVGAGGALETVVDGETGILVEPDDVDALARSLAGIDFARFDPERIAAHARTFSKQAFQRRLRAEVGSSVDS